MLKYAFYLSVLFFFSCNNTQLNKNDFPVLKGEYLGQQLPGDSARLFAPQIVSTGAGERDVAMMPDGKEIYFCREINGFKYATILVTKLVNGAWTEPEVPDIFNNPEYLYFEPHISPKGHKLFFVSNMPADTGKIGNEDIWVSERIGDKWGKPYNIGPPVNTDSREYFPSVTNDGTLYYNHVDPELNDEFIYRSRLVNGKYAEPEKVEGINIGKGRFNALIARDESYIILPIFGMPDSYGGVDYYIFYRNNEGEWSQAINMGPKVNSNNLNEWSPSISPDNRFFFFMSGRMDGDKTDIGLLTAEKMKDIYNSPQNGNSDIYWISTGFIKDLREKAVFN